MTVILADATWPEVDVGSVVLVPVGSIEQHGPHLPLDTDAAIADAVAHRAADLLGETPAERPVMVAPVLPYGASGEHQAFPGTCSLGSEALRLVFVELVRSIRTWAGRVVLVNGHGGNVDGLRAAVAQLRREGHDIAWMECAAPDAGQRVDAHAGFTETSLMLHLRPESVRLSRAEPGNTAPLGRLIDRLASGGMAEVSANGVLGDPTGASAVEGARLLQAMAAEVARRVRQWLPDDTGRLCALADART